MPNVSELEAGRGPDADPVPGLAARVVGELLHLSHHRWATPIEAALREAWNAGRDAGAYHMALAAMNPPPRDI